MTWPANAPETPRCWVFLIDLEPGAEAVLRALGVFPAQGAEVRRMSLDAVGDAARLEVEAHGLDAIRAGRLGARLAQLTAVRAVASGWR